MAENDVDANVHQNGGEVADLDVENFVNEFIRDRLRSSGYDWDPPVRPSDTTRTIEAEVGIALRSLADDFTSLYHDQVSAMCAKWELTADKMYSNVEAMANELFGEGIKWVHIVVFFIFGSELAISFKEKNAHELINTLAHSISVYVTVTLLPWINHHGGWSGLIQFMEEGRQGEGQNGGNRWPSVKNLICIGMTAVGAITIGAVLSRT